jgi:hypothetical protein
VYDLEVVIRSRPLHVPGIAAEERVKEIIESALAAWGIPPPYRLKGAATEHAFVDQLAETGEYLHAEAEYSIVVKRSA